MKTKMRIVAGILVCIAVFMSFASCTVGPNMAEEESSDKYEVPTDVSFDGNLALAIAQADSKNPYFAKSVLNTQLMPLVYDSLVKQNAEHETALYLAQDGTLQNENSTVFVTLKKAVFSDGTTVSANDVIYSFNLAKKSSVHQAELANIHSASAKDGGISFALAKKDPYALACLTFPVVKNGTADTKDKTPIGSGRYKFAGEGSSLTLQMNNKHTLNALPKIEVIRLVNLADSSAYANSLQIGNTHFMYNDLSSGKYSRITSNTVPVELSNLVYLGFNSATAILKEPLMLKAINAALDRSEIATSAYQGHATASSHPMHPRWNELKLAGVTQQEFAKDSASKMLDGVDTFKLNSSGKHTYQNKVITLKLLVSDGNSFRVKAANTVATQLTSMGIEVITTVVKFDAYKSTLASGAYDLYIGEIKLTENMDLAPFYTAGGQTAFGINQNTDTAKKYWEMRNGTATLLDYINQMSESPSFFPLCFRNGVAAYDGVIKGTLVCLENDPYYNISDWNF